MPTPPTPADHELAALIARLTAANASVARHHPGESGRRQPVHTVYGGAHLFRHDKAQRLGQYALRALAEEAPDAATFAGALGIDAGAEHAQRVYERVVEKLTREPVEDMRVDFEDGYGNRKDEEEDEHARTVAAEFALGAERGTLPAFTGIRIKTFSDDRLRARAMRTAELVVGETAKLMHGALPANFVICLPKIRHREHVAVLADFLGVLERRHGLAAGALKLELMIEAPLSIVDERGQIALPGLLEAAQGRCVAAHFGTYDYTASCNITAEWQAMGHPACDFARQMMQVAYAGTGIFLSDGATNVLPVGPNTAGKDEPPLTELQRRVNRKVVHHAWKLHFKDVQTSLRLGFYQGWDLHPGQLPSRYAALYDFFLSDLDGAGTRLRNFVAKSGQATLVGDVFDDAATGQGLLNYFLRAQSCGAITEAEALARTGLKRKELETRSFLRILEGRRGK